MYKLFRASSIPYFEELAPIVRRYLKDANLYERRVDEVFEQIHTGLRSDGSLWLIRNQTGVLLGFAFAEIKRAHHSAVAQVPHVYVDHLAHRGLFLRQIEEAVESWAKSCGAREIVFTTRRNPFAFLRKLKKGWLLDSVSLKRKLQ